MRQLASLGVPLGGSSSSSSSAMADGLYFAIQASSTPPAPTNALGWASTTVYNDVGVNDHTTYKQDTNAGGATNWVFAMSYVAAGQTWATYTASIGYTDAGSYQALYWNGSAWVSWDSPLLIGGSGTFAWQDLSRNPTDQSSIAVCIGVKDAVGFFSGPWDARIGDFRPST